MRALIILVFSALILTGCGQKGSLYLPKSKNIPQSHSTDMDHNHS